MLLSLSCTQIHQLWSAGIMNCFQSPKLATKGREVRTQFNMNDRKRKKPKSYTNNIRKMLII